MVRVAGDAEELVEGLEAAVPDGAVELQAPGSVWECREIPFRAAGQGWSCC